MFSCMFPMYVIVRIVSTQLENVENELESSMNQCEVLRHTLSDRQAQIDLQSTHDNVSRALILDRRVDLLAAVD